MHIDAAKDAYFQCLRSNIFLEKATSNDYDVLVPVHCNEAFYQSDLLIGWEKSTAATEQTTCDNVNLFAQYLFL